MVCIYCGVYSTAQATVLHDGANPTQVCYSRLVKSSELKRWLEQQGCTFATTKSGHLRVFLGDRQSVLPMHGARKDLGKGLVEAIKKDLGLKEPRSGTLKQGE